MPRVFVTNSLKPLIPHESSIEIDARTIRGVVDELEHRYPGAKSILCADNALKPGVAVSVDGRVAALGLFQKVGPDCEVHFILAIGGG